jgi:glycosyltransferase involved in cell wall biosynthesis
MPRVCMLTTRFYPDHGGGALQAMRLCQKLAEREVSAFVIAGRKNGTAVEHTVQDIPVVRVPLPRREGMAVLSFYWRILKRLVARRREYDLIHAHAIHHHAYVGFLVGHLLNKPVIAKIVGSGIDTPERVRGRRLGGIQVRLMSLATRVVVTSQELYDRTVSEGFPATRMVSIPNGTDTQLFCPVGDAERLGLRKSLGLPSEALVAVFVGAVRSVKGIDVLAKAWPRLAASWPSLHICLVGPYRKEEHWGIDPEYVGKLQRHFALGDDAGMRVHFVGQVSNVSDYLQAADLFVFPSRSEGMPNALLEAMACGLPFVATRLGCIEEMSPPEQRPYLVDVDDADGLAEAIIALARDADARRRLGAAVRQTVEAQYSLDAVADRYVRLYLNLLENQL